MPNQDVLMGQIRHLLTVAGTAWIASHPGRFTDGDVDAIVSIIMILAPMGWSALEKLRRAPVKIVEVEVPAKGDGK